MIDSHAHLGDEAFYPDLDLVVERAKAAGLVACIVVGELPSQAKRIREIAKTYSGWAFPSLGLYPSEITDKTVAEFETLAQENWVCFGEVGLDTWVVKDEVSRQRNEEAFRRVIQLARYKDIPVNVHTRNCGKRSIEILLEENASRVHLHAFDAKPSTVRMGIEAGFYFSIPTSVVHAPQKQKLALLVPLEQLMLETDSPVLGADRTARNEPANLKLALQAVADLRQMDLKELEQQLDANTCKLYKLDSYLSLE